MKTGRNDPCPCGSGKKYKQCCIDRVSKQSTELQDELEKIVAMNPNLTVDELNVVLQHRMFQRNHQPEPDFHGLSPNQMANWLHAPFHELAGVVIRTPPDLSGSPVMRYLDLILDEAMHGDGAFKATSKGNLPAALAIKASALLPEFAVAKYAGPISISEFAGHNEDAFNALHYTRILAELGGIIYRRSGRFHVKKAAQKKYQSQGVAAFFDAMLEAAVTRYNWAYMDRWQDSIDLRTFWLFMVWRLQSHASVEQLVDDVIRAFPALLSMTGPDTYAAPEQLLGHIVESRFVSRFLEFWGFVVLDPQRYRDNEKIPRRLELQPLLGQTFEFLV